MSRKQYSFHVRVGHSLGFSSSYDIVATDYNDAEREAKQRFIDDFCGGKNETTFRGVTEKHAVTAFTINKYAPHPSETPKK